MDLKEAGCECAQDSSRSILGVVMGSYKHRYGRSGPMKNREFTDKLSHYQLLINDSVSWGLSVVLLRFVQSHSCWDPLFCLHQAFHSRVCFCTNILTLCSPHCQTGRRKVW
jgi:hypothetical protein